MPRFVILRHTMPPDAPRKSHWDVMLEDGETLATWAVESAPATNVTQPAHMLAPHRLSYLDYEGPVSGNRGDVKRWDVGDFEWQVREVDMVRVLVRGQRLDGMIELDVVKNATKPQTSAADQVTRDAAWSFVFRESRSNIVAE